MVINVASYFEVFQGEKFFPIFNCVVSCYRALIKKMEMKIKK